MRRFLNALYAASAVVAAGATVLIALLIFVQVAGRSMGYGIRGLDDFVAWLAASACIAGIGYAFKAGSHVKVELLTERLPQGLRHPVNLLACALGLCIAAFACYATGRMVLESYQFNDVSQGDFAVPLWIPQLGVAFGMLVLLVAVTEEFFFLLRGRSEPRPLAGDGTSAEI